MIIDPVVYIFRSDPSQPTSFVIIFKNTGYQPTGNNIQAYKIASPNIELPIVGLPVIDYVNQTLTVIVAGNSALQTNDQCIITFEVKEI